MLFIIGISVIVAVLVLILSKKTSALTDNKKAANELVPEGEIVLIVVNDTHDTNSLSIQYDGKFANIRLRPGAVGTYIWKMQ